VTVIAPDRLAELQQVVAGVRADIDEATDAARAGEIADARDHIASAHGKLADAIAGARRGTAATNGAGPKIRHGKLGEPVAVYKYQRASGDVAFVVCRFEPKDFRPAQLRGGRWVWNLEGAPALLYRLPAVERSLGAGDGVWIVDGEKDADALATAGVCATCSARAQGWSLAHSEQLTGARWIRIVVDQDGGVGARQAEAVRASLVDAGAIASSDIELVQAAEGKDAHDHLAAGHGLDAFQPYAPPDNDARPFTITVYSARELAALELPESAEQLVGPFIRRGMATLIGGLTGHGKSSWIARVLHAAVNGGDFIGHDVTGGCRVLVLDLEQHLASIQRVIREAGIADADAIDYAPIPEGLAIEKRDDQLAELERVLAAEPYDIVAVDPFYKLHEADSSDELQARLLVALLRRWINEHGFALLTATHCRKLPAGRTSITLDDLFGSSLFTRDPETILGIQRHGDLTKLHVFKSREPGLDHGQTFELLYNRDRGYWLKPTVDPEERLARLTEIGGLAVSWITEHPGESTNKVKTAVASGAKCGGDLVEDALAAQVKSGLLPAPVKGSRNAKLWYPLNHAALTSPATLLGEVTEGAQPGQNGDDFTRPPDLYVVEREGAGEVDEAEELEWR
jgi:hypothetical protein